MITDEVYEQLVFDGRRHLPLANYPGMADRTITISSAAKMFNCTGWKIGWACGACRTDRRGAGGQAVPHLCGRRPVPARRGRGARPPRTPGWPRCGTRCRPSGTGWARALSDIGFEVHDSFGTYFLCADPRPLGYHDSTAFCAELPERAGVAAIPMSAFCDPDAAHVGAWNHLVRFAFCKRDDTLEEAIRRLGVLRR